VWECFCFWSGPRPLPQHTHTICPSWVLGFRQNSPKNSVYMSILWQDHQKKFLILQTAEQCKGVPKNWNWKWKLINYLFYYHSYISTPSRSTHASPRPPGWVIKIVFYDTNLIILQIPNQLFFSELKMRFSASDTELYVGIRYNRAEKLKCQKDFLHDSSIDLRCWKSLLSAEKKQLIWNLLILVLANVSSLISKVIECKAR
jgi:hypothetical protein